MRGNRKHGWRSAGRAVIVSVAVGIGTQEAGAGSWPTFHGPPSLTGLADVKLPDSLTPLWRFKAAAGVSETPVADELRLYFVTDGGEVCAIDRKGAKAWTRKVTKPDAAAAGGVAAETFTAPPIVVNGMVVIGSDAGTLYAFDAATGNEKWKYDLGDNVKGTANWSKAPEGDGWRVIQITQSQGILHCVDPSTGQAVWKTAPIVRCDGCAAVDGGRIVFGACSAAIHVYTVAKGEEQGGVELGEGSEMAGGLALAGDMAFTGTRGGQMLCADLKKKATAWSSEDSTSEVFATPAVSDTHVVFGSNDGCVYGCDRKTGKRAWSFETKGAPSSPVIAGDKVVVSGGGTLYLLRLQDGAKVWSKEMGDSITSPAVVDGMVVVGGDDGHVTALGAEPAK